MSIASKFYYLLDTKTRIKESIKSMGIDVSDDTTFEEYPAKIDEIPAGIDMTSTRLYKVVEDIWPIGAFNRLSTTPDYRYRSWVLSKTAGDKSVQDYNTFVNKSGKPMLFMCTGFAGYPYGNGLAVDNDCVKDVDYSVENGTGSSQYWGALDTVITTPKGHKVHYYYTNYSNTYDTAAPKVTVSTLGLSSFAIGTLASPALFVVRTYSKTYTIIGILADYLIFGER